MKRVIRVSPSIIATSYKDNEILFQAIEDLEKAGANWLHLDVMDGKFVQNTTFDYSFVEKIKGKTKMLLDVHLMVQKPEDVIDKYVKAGADILTVHYEACKDPASALKKIKSKNNIIAGLAISPETPVLKIKDLIENSLVDLILVMTVIPGASGQAFMPDIAEKVAEIRELNKKILIEVDGGVNSKNSKSLRNMGANILVSGSFIFNSKNMKKTINQLKGKGFFYKLKEFFEF